MDDRIKQLLNKVQSNYYNKHRQNIIVDINNVIDCEEMPWEKQVSFLLNLMVKKEKAIIEPDEKIVFFRTVPHPLNPVPSKILQYENNEEIQLIGNRVHNICADWEMILNEGLGKRKAKAEEALKKFGNNKTKRIYLESVIESIDSVIYLVNKYKKAAKKLHREDIYMVLEHVPYGKPHSFFEALQSLRILYGALWLNGHNHIGLGRFDFYMWPYLKSDLQKHIITIDDAKNMLMEFFISLNKDTDIYPGIQKGDNGQTLILGGIDFDGNSVENILTYLVLEVSKDLKLPDPKINLRIHKNTSEYCIELASKLVQVGLGFPQFSNDEVVIPALIENGYDIKHARNYVVAACWEFIIPGVGMDVPNINAVSFPTEVDEAIRYGLNKNLSYQDILNRTCQNIENRVAGYIKDKENICYWPPAPLFSVYMNNCIENAIDINNGGAIYNNYGIHGCGISHAVDALVAVKELVFINKIIKPKEFLLELENNWSNSDIRNKVLYSCSKVGNNDKITNELINTLFNFFARACKKFDGKLNKYHKPIRIRPGSGSAMYYVWFTQKNQKKKTVPILKATADGRKENDFISTNLSTSINTKTQGPISLLLSFSNIDYSKIYNGGPITIELLPRSFSGARGYMQIINLIKTFIVVGCQQLQLNMVSKSVLMEAQKHPEMHKNLIVRVWGWSAYFCDLDKVFQDQIISRQFFS